MKIIVSNISLNRIFRKLKNGQLKISDFYEQHYKPNKEKIKEFFPIELIGSKGKIIIKKKFIRERSVNGRLYYKFHTLEKIYCIELIINGKKLAQTVIPCSY